MLVFLAAVSMAVVSAGCGSDTYVELECPSPDGSIVAVLFSRSGGGAAGWFVYQLALQPAGVTPTPPERFGGGPSKKVLEVDGFRALTLSWDGNERLSVEAAVRDLTTVDYLVHQYPAFPPEGQRRVRIAYIERDPTRREVDSRAEDRVCRSGGREIVNPPSRHLVDN
jgi:hypothetical protein